MRESDPLQRAGGVAAFAAALAYVFGFAVLFGPLAKRPATIDEGLLYLLEHRALVTSWYLVIYIAFGVALLVLTLALSERLRASVPSLSSFASALALVWVTLVVAAGMCLVVGLDAAGTLHSEDAARAVTLWLVVETIADGLGGGIEVVGGLWLTLLGIAGWRSGIDARALHALALVSGMAGLLTALPPLSSLGAVFGLGQIVWFVGIGCELVRTPPIHRSPGQCGCGSSARDGQSTVSKGVNGTWV